MKIGVNTFGLGPYLKKDEMSVWEGLRKAGVASIEPSVFFRRQLPQTDAEKADWKRGKFAGFFDSDKAGEKIEMLRAMGFEVFTFHLQVPHFSIDVVPEVISFMEDCNLQYCVYSYMDSSVEKIKSRSSELLQAAQLFRAHGKELLVHNHDMEWLPDEGTSVMQWLLDNMPDLRFEIDLGWTEYSGISALDILMKYTDRFPLLHIKETAPGATAWTEKPFCTVPGEGILPLRELLAFIKGMPIEERAVIIDQDDAISGDIVSDIAKGIQNINRLMAES